jgi:hypothetical protein
MLKSGLSSQSGGGVLVGFEEGVGELAELAEPAELDDCFTDFEAAESDAWLLLDVSCELVTPSFGAWVAKVRLLGTIDRT